MGSRGWLVGVAAIAIACGTWRAVAMRRGHHPGRAAPTAPTSGWPGPETRLHAPLPAFPPDFGVRRVAIDPGHGAHGNKGALSCFCVDEQVFTLAAAAALRDRLEATGHLGVTLSREGEAPVEYRDRLDDAAAWGAEAFISLHSDVRGKADRWAPDAGQDCPINLGAPGFSILYSDEGSAPLVEARSSLARATAIRMHDAGFLAYDGASYTGLYAADPVAPGAFLDRHVPARRIFVLERAAMPSILIETHHALDPREAERWTEDATLDAFAAAVAAALADTLGRADEPARRAWAH